VRAFVEASRYPFQKAAAGLGEGTRGSGSQGYASQIWGIPADQYIRVADTWPLNPEGEILLGLKVEDRFAVANVARSVAVPGIAFSEWGPGDMAWSLKLTVDHSKPYPPAMLEMRAKVFSAVKANKKFFLDGVRLPTIESNLKEGIMIGSGDEATANAGRRITKREMPW
jgi:4-hydroxy-2-oxoheptanedioate aldolase